MVNTEECLVVLLWWSTLEILYAVEMLRTTENAVEMLRTAESGRIVFSREEHNSWLSSTDGQP